MVAETKKREKMSLSSDGERENGENEKTQIKWKDYKGVAKSYTNTTSE